MKKFVLWSTTDCKNVEQTLQKTLHDIKQPMGALVNATPFFHFNHHLFNISEINMYQSERWLNIHLAIQTSFPTLANMWTTGSIDELWTVESAGSMNSMMILPVGNDRYAMRRLPASSPFGTTPFGDTVRLENAISHKVSQTYRILFRWHFFS